MKLRARLETVIVMNEREAAVMHVIAEDVAKNRKIPAADQASHYDETHRQVAREFADASGKAAALHSEFDTVKDRFNLDND